MPEAILDAAFLKKLERLSLVTKRPFAGQMKGEKRSVKRGTSVEFADYREYILGDDPSATWIGIPPRAWTSCSSSCSSRKRTSISPY